MTARIVVIGTGYWGKNLLRNIDALNSLHGFFDSDPDTSQAMSAQYPRAAPYNSLDSVFLDPSVDAVAIASPASIHGEMVDRALKAGKHVFVEKPLCLDVQQARRLGRLADESGCVLMVGHLLLYHPAFIALRECVSAGTIGRIRYIYSTRASLGKIRRTENALWSFAPHDISMMLALTGRMPLKVSCKGEAWLSPQVADTTLSHFDFGDRLQAHIFVSWLHPYKDHRLVVIGETGMIVFNDTLAEDQKLLRYPHTVEWSGDLPILDRAEAVPIPYERNEPLRQEMQHFLDCIKAGNRPISDAVEGVNVLTVLDCCQKAMDCDTTVWVEKKDWK